MPDRVELTVIPRPTCTVQHSTFSPGGSLDRAAAFFLFAATVAYLASLPRYLGWADESYFLHEAKRIRDGEVMYRDIFQFIPPLASYVMALLFGIFGTTITTARVAMAVLHGLVVAVLYRSCRIIGVRPSIAAVVPVAYLALCQPLWPFASPHWFATLLALMLLRVLLDDRLPVHPRRALVPGLVTGLLAGVQHQKGVLIAAGVAALLVVDAVLDRRYQPGSMTRGIEGSRAAHKGGARSKGAGEARTWRAVVAALAWFAAGVLAVTVPLLAVVVAQAGVGPVYDALVLFPLDSYRHGHSISWGSVAPLSDPYVAATWPAVLRLSPVIVLGPFLAAVLHAARRTQREALRRRATLVVFSVFSVASIWYFPDLIHIAFIAPVFLICAGDVLEHALGSLPSPRLARVLGWGIAAVLAAGLLQHATCNTVRALREFTIPHETAFGRIDFAQSWEPMFVDRVRALLDAAPTRELFSYPNVTSVYLTAGAKNPTRFQYLLARVSPPEHIREAMQVLQERQVAYIVASPMIFMGRSDPMAQFIKDHYDSFPVPEIIAAGELPSFWLYRRKADGDDPP
jgi:hypothetical protein